MTDDERTAALAKVGAAVLDALGISDNVLRASAAATNGRPEAGDTAGPGRATVARRA